MENELLGPIVRAFRLVEELAEAPEAMTGKEIADLLELPNSTAHRLLQILSKIEIVERTGDGQRYAPGAMLFRIAFAAMRKSDVTVKSRPHLQAIVDELDMTTVLWIYFDTIRTLVASNVIRSRHKLDFQQVTFLPRGLAWGNVGRVVLAHLRDDVVKDVVKTAGKSPTGMTMGSLRTVNAELAKVRKQGFAFSAGHTVAEAVGISAPVFDYRGEIIGCLASTTPAMRFDAKETDRYASVIMREAGALSEALGYRP